MSLEIALLRALLRLSRRTRPTTLQLLSKHLGLAAEQDTSLRRALQTLARAGLVQGSPKGPRLSMIGLAVAVAAAAPVRAKRLPGAPNVGRSRRRAA